MYRDGHQHVELRRHLISGRHHLTLALGLGGGEFVLVEDAVHFHRVGPVLCQLLLETFRVLVYVMDLVILGDLEQIDSLRLQLPRHEFL